MYIKGNSHIWHKNDVDNNKNKSKMVKDLLLIEQLKNRLIV